MNRALWVALLALPLHACTEATRQPRTVLAIGGGYGVATARGDQPTVTAAALQAVPYSVTPTQTHRISHGTLAVTHQTAGYTDIGVVVEGNYGRVTDTDSAIGHPRWSQGALGLWVGRMGDNVGWSAGVVSAGAPIAVAGREMYSTFSVYGGWMRSLFAEFRLNSHNGPSDPGVVTVQAHVRGQNRHLTIGTGGFGRSVPLFMAKQVQTGVTAVEVSSKLGPATNTTVLDAGLQLEFMNWFNPSTGLQLQACIAQNWMAALALVVGWPHAVPGARP